MSKADDIFFKQFGVILGTLVLFAISVYIIATSIGNSEYVKFMSQPAAINERITPVGSVRIEGDKLATKAAKAPVQAAAADSGGKSGQDIYGAGCIACHAAGVAGAPKLGDNANWAKRAEAGLDALLTSVTKGKGAMPPKGGTAFSAQELEKAVRYMLDESGVKL